MTAGGTAAPGPAPPPDPLAVLRSRAYLKLLLLAFALGVPISFAAYFFLQLVARMQHWVFADLPASLGFGAAPSWWPVPPLVLAGVLVGLTIRYLPGRGGAIPAHGFHAGGPPATRELPGIALAALAALGLGVALGPEAPLIALGAGLAATVVRLGKRDAPPRTVGVVGATGSFAAISTLLGSPLLGAFLLMETSGLGGAAMGLVLVPGLLAAGVGTLIFIGLNSLTGLGVVSLALPDLPPFDRPDLAQFGWAVAIGVLAALFGGGIRRLGLAVKQPAESHPVLIATIAGLVIGILAAGYAAATAKSFSDVLFSGQDQLGPLLVQGTGYSLGTLLLLLVCKGLAYGVALGSLRGGPVFPAMFLGAAGGIALSHLPGLSLVPAVAMGIGAMCVAMLRLPLTSVLLATLLLGADGLAVTPLVIVAVVVAHVVAARFTRAPAAEPSPAAAVTVTTSRRGAATDHQAREAGRG
jgi:chloride channel protein, CIC family